MISSSAFKVDAVGNITAASSIDLSGELAAEGVVANIWFLWRPDCLLVELKKFQM